MNDYKILEIDKNASISEIKKAYQNLIKKYHPDKNKNSDASDKFIKIQEAYKNIIKKQTGNSYFNVLNELYHEGIFDKYVNLFYNNFIYNYPNNNKIITINCTLEELYNSCIKTIKYERKIAISPINHINEEKIINLNVNHNNYHNQRIEYQNLGDKIEFDNSPKNLIIIIKEEQHEHYKREDDNLIINIDLTLKEALTCNTTIKIPLLNNSYYEYQINKIINNNFEEIIKNYGMPLGNNKFGNLIIKFNVIFPDKLTNLQINTLNKIL